MRKFWNYSFLGLFGFFYLISKRAYNGFLDGIFTFIFNFNISYCGKNVVVRRGLIYRYPNAIQVFNNVEIGENVSFTSELDSGSLVLNDKVTIGRSCKLDFSGGIVIQENCLLSENVCVQTHDHGLNPKNAPIGKSLVIEKNVWIGMNCLILSNCYSIGENSIVGAGSVVTGNIPPNSIYVGNPAKFLKRI
ncbi:acyltransferase [Algoriphagus sp.]|uniref:acyltransferase n=1 Tax=Algoriphagus sp. TaxID=1872435 RepID=UPI00261405C6|nr:acyltransferase [Algoriphagus sp.]